MLSAATVKPEDVRNVEVGLKTEPLRGVTANLTVYNTDDRGLPGAGHQRQRRRAARLSRQRREGARARRRVRRQRARLHRDVSLYGAVAYTDGKYVSFPRRAAAARGHRRAAGQGHLGLGAAGHLEVGGVGRRRVRARRGRCSAGRASSSAPLDASYRSSFSSSASYSRYLVVDGYSLLNARVGFRAADGWTVFVWSRNLLDKDYFELLTAAPGNTGLYVGQPGDGRTVGVTLRVALKSR